MFSFTVHATESEMRDLLASTSTRAVSCDEYETGLVEMSMDDDQAVDFTRALNRRGFVWHTGRPRGAHADPTFARAAQRIAFANHHRG